MTEISVERNLLDEDARIAAENREKFRRARVYALNLMSGPGAGKTTLLESTIERLRGRIRLAVIAGDIETRRDADRLARRGAPVVQINTRGDCHLDARRIAGALKEMNLAALDMVIVENVGNLVCPAEFDLGEHDKAMILSVAEGHDKPAKYPLMFREARAMVVNKIDLLPYTNFDVEAAVADARTLNPNLEVFRLSARTGDGLDGWLTWLDARLRSVRA